MASPKDHSVFPKQKFEAGLSGRRQPALHNWLICARQPPKHRGTKGNNIRRSARPYNEMAQASSAIIVAIKLYGICQAMHEYARQHPLFMHDRAPTAWHRSLRPERLTVTLPCPAPCLWAAARKTGVTWACRSDDSGVACQPARGRKPQRRSHAGGRRQAGPRPRVSDFGSGLGAAIVRQLRSSAVRRGEWTPGQCV
jgi:hypothetical protein